ncbi:MAG: hypothetical protein JO013_11475 [Alphaproteobacteria bacterium]|nr:hypothetical protein [Alphaproteobacteria bacterium]
MRFVMLAGAALVAAGLCSSGAVAADAGKKSDSDKLICRTMDELGSRLASKRVCLTRSQWRQQEDMKREGLDKIRIRTGQDGH